MSRERMTLDTFADFSGEVNGVTIRSHLPLESYVPSSEIDVEIGRIARAASLGHQSSIAFRGYSEKSFITAGVDTVGDDGSATASFTASAVKAERIDSDLSMPDIVTRKGTGTVRINFAHDDLDGVNLREAKPWANHVDTSIKEGLRSTANKKLMGKIGYRIGSAVFLLGGMGTLVAIKNPSALGITSAVALGEVTYNAVLVAFSGREGEFTSVPFVPIDRLGLVQAYTHTRRFATTK